MFLTPRNVIVANRYLELYIPNSVDVSRQLSRRTLLRLGGTTTPGLAVATKPHRFSLDGIDCAYTSFVSHHMVQYPPSA